MNSTYTWTLNAWKNGSKEHIFHSSHSCIGSSGYLCDVCVRENDWFSRARYVSTSFLTDVVYPRDQKHDLETSPLP